MYLFSWISYQEILYWILVPYFCWLLKAHLINPRGLFVTFLKITDDFIIRTKACYHLFPTKYN